MNVTVNAIINFDFYKYHGLGNDYIVIDPGKVNFPFKVTAENIKLICDRNYGIGSDGILYGPIINDKDRLFELRIFNPDGSEAEKSGNGIRIFAQYLLDAGYVRSDSFSFLIPKSGIVSIEIIDKLTKELRVHMGQYSYSNAKITLDGNEMDVSCINVGNPHCVVFVDDFQWLNSVKEAILKYGPIIENDPLFPNRTNVQFVKIIDDKNLQIEIWERGAGYTLASGSSSVAAACAAFNRDLVKNKVAVHMSGGIMDVEIRGRDVYLNGTVSNVCYGFIAEDLKKQLN